MTRIFSKRSYEGYLKIDHRAGEGITPELAQTGGGGVIPVGSGRMLETSTINCSHCERLVVMNPLRTRARGYCPKCDKYVCDECEAARVQTGVCKPFKQVIDEFIDNAAKGKLLIP